MNDMDIDEAASRWPDTFEPERWDREKKKRRNRLVIVLCAGLAVLAFVVLAGPAIFFRAEGPTPKHLALPVGPGGTVGPVNGTWAVAAPSEVQYRVTEILFGQHHVAVGTTSQVHGSLRIEGATVTSARFSVDMASVRSGTAGRDSQFSGGIMDTDSYPRGYFTLTKAINLGKVPRLRRVVNLHALGELTLRGRSRAVEFPLRVERYGNGIDANGALTIRFGRWGIPNPSFAVTRVGSTGTIDVLLHLVRKGT
ncbi:MAG: YceI family protein, partial [Acidimicrobiales bacterium]